MSIWILRKQLTAIMECAASFALLVATLSALLSWRILYQTRAQAEIAIARYIGGFYNPTRWHSALDYLSPAQFERLAA